MITEEIKELTKEIKSAIDELFPDPKEKQEVYKLIESHFKLQLKNHDLVKVLVETYMNVMYGNITQLIYELKKLHTQQPRNKPVVGDANNDKGVKN